LKKKAVLTELERTNDYVSGEQLSEILGVSRTAVWKQIKSLREQGYEIEAQPRIGYRLLKRPDLLLPAEIASGLNTTCLGQEVVYYPEVDSTNEIARQLALQGAAEGTLVVAERQTKGKGRLGRTWISPEGEGLWFSLILRPKMLPQEAPRATLVAAVAVAQALRQETGLNIRIKWPNDLLLEGKKITGILTEMNSEIGRINFLVVGIGINVNLNFETIPPEISATATSLSAYLTQPVSRLVLLQRCLEELEKYYELWQKGAFPEILVEWRQLSATLGNQVQIKMFDDTIEGFAEEVELDGSLRLRLADGSVYQVIAGDVAFDPAKP
jgi:BirA family biotin operon repressor/biotin-[acetyl-CoA-carboxylase] ligase